jgi:hypothetical protein
MAPTSAAALPRLDDRDSLPSGQGENEMRAIFITMLAVDAALILATAAVILKGKRTTHRSRPVWSSLSFALLIAGSTSFQIADKHDHDPGARILQYASGLLLGMALFALLVLVRERLGTDRGN